jgi:hypothetical protein
VEILSENREVEKLLSPEKNGKPAISLCGDARWDKRSSGRNYSSLSGCSLAVGCCSQLAWDIEQMSNACIKCVRKIEHDVKTCAQNVTCSAKAMEALGSSKIINTICERGDCFVSEYVGGDDSSSKKVVRHSYADLLREGKLDEWPRYKGADTKKGPKKPDTGLLPISHPEITFLVDRNHRIRQIAKQIFFLYRQKKKDCVGNPQHDAERLKRCMAHAVRQNCDKDSETMKAAVTQVTEHHFGNHSDCGSWCRVRDLEGPERKEADLNYREKTQAAVTNATTTSG